MLSCIAVIAIATFVGTITFESNTYKNNGLLIQNVEALTEGDADQGDQGSSIYTCPNAYSYARVCGYRISYNRICHETVIDCLGGGYGCNPRRCPYHG
ncbi:MAG: hypothetical protein J5521_03065 [Lachnospiraceae bacterium]|nr:hypothetical protein [Lachnospiraceae bacterium]